MYSQKHTTLSESFGLSTRCVCPVETSWWTPSLTPHPHERFLPQKVENPQHAISYQVGGFYFLRGVSTGQT